MRHGRAPVPVLCDDRDGDGRASPSRRGRFPGGRGGRAGGGHLSGLGPRQARATKSTGGQRIVHGLDTSDEDRPLPGRHRATPSVTRRAAGRAAIWSVGVLAAAVLGVITAGAVGLTETSQGPAGAAAALASPGPPQTDPRVGRTIDIRRPSAARTQESVAADVVVDPAVEEPPPTPATGAERPPDDEPRPAEPARRPAEAPVRTVRPGDSCSAEGATGVTARGKPTVCTARSGDGRTRWRHA